MGGSIADVPLPAGSSNADGADPGSSSAMPRTVARREPRRRLTWPDSAPPVGIHLGVAGGLMKAGRRARQIGATALQIFSDNPTAWRRRPEPPADAAAFVAYAAANGIAPISIHASYLINLAGSAEPFASQSRDGLIHELRRAPAVRRHAGEHAHRVAPRPGTSRRPAADRGERGCHPGRDPGGDVPGARELRRRRRQPRLEDRGAGRDPGGREPASREPARRSAWTRRTCGAPATTSRRPTGASAVLDRFEAADRDGAPAARPPQRLALGARLAQRSARARGRRDASVRWDWAP